jgi:hydrogenase maturation protein HypF
MPTFYIHINGLVQGVGFRPHVHKIAKEMGIMGWVKNNTDGVQININATKEIAQKFLAQVISAAPTNAVITNTNIEHIEDHAFLDFKIEMSENANTPNILIPPDYAICSDCKQEIDNNLDKRHAYAFTSCVACGPRYSIIKDLPYDRQLTTMQYQAMCVDCEKEYHDIANRRYHSEINSCPNCTIPIHLFNSTNTCLSHESSIIIDTITNAIIAGETVAVKNTGGYLLLCDATNKKAIELLRNKKRRPSKPFAVLYPTIEMAMQDVHINNEEKTALASTVAPIVLCKIKQADNIATTVIAPLLDKIGVMLPSSALLYIIATKLNRPIIATSANLSGSPIIYKDIDALENLFEFASLVLTYDREIITPQDDSVLQYTEKGQRIILRRSRGLAPNYFPNNFGENNEKILATGGELKSAFALTNNKQVYISQFLGDQGNLVSQEAFTQTYTHLLKMFREKPEAVLIDAHPNYFVSEMGTNMANELQIPVIPIQHHKAHFASVLAENNLLSAKQNILGFIWDGTGFGDDKQIWGSELLSYKDGFFTRISHLEYFPVLVVDKMSKEPRLAALSLLKQINEDVLIKDLFTSQEWDYYQKVLKQPATIQTSSMGRFLDGLACLLGIESKTSYEGEAVMQLEAMARSSKPHKSHYDFIINENSIGWQPLLFALIFDINLGRDKSFIARKIINSLVELVIQISNYNGVCQLAFSGGVFQNALLVNSLIERTGKTKTLFFHKNVSTNDEGISLGQIAYYLNQKQQDYVFSNTRKINSHNCAT